ncbi:MAG: hypothetical protein ACHQK9_18210 [Reyranellales bacterium]
MSARRSLARWLSYALWAAFALLVVASSAILLRACGLLTPFTSTIRAWGWNFCPATPPTFSAETERAEMLAKLVRQLELELAEKNLACASILPAQPPPLELPTQPNPTRPQQTAELKPPPAPPKPPPPLPADRWDKKDLSLLKGCWQLGHETRTNMAKGNGRVEMCTVQAGTICFGDDGRGEREQNASCQSTGAYSCKAPITATFRDGGTLNTTQPQVTCAPSSITWNAKPNYLSCRRVSDTLALCRDSLNFEHEFRRKAGP